MIRATRTSAADWLAPNARENRLPIRSVGDFCHLRPSRRSFRTPGGATFIQTSLIFAAKLRRTFKMVSEHPNSVTPKTTSLTVNVYTSRRKHLKRQAIGATRASSRKIVSLPEPFEPASLLCSFSVYRIYRFAGSSVRVRGSDR